MRKFIDTFIDRPVFASMIILAMVVVGAAGYFNLGVDRFPSVDLPTVSVRTNLPGASPEEAESELAEPMEEAVNTVAGIDELRSIVGNGNALVLAQFDLGRDIDVAAQDVRDKIAGVQRRLPDDADVPTVSKFDNDSDPVIGYVLSGNRSLRELTEIADKTVKVQLERSDGVGEVALNGGAERTMNVDLDADRLAAYGLPVTAVRDAVVKANSDVPGGTLTGAEQERALRTLGRLADAEAFREVVVARRGDAIIRVRDVASVTDGAAERRSVTRYNGRPAVKLDVRRQSGANTVATIEAVKKNAERVIAALPPGVTLTPVRDQSDYIYSALHEINLHLILGSIFACLVVFAFTRSWRSTVVAGVAIPASVVSTFAVMWALGFTLNSVTMLALVLMVGIVIDDAIVVLENIFRFVEEKDLSPMEAARQGTHEIATAVLATTLSLAVIFIPVSFMSSISGRFLYQFGITAAVAVMVSLLVSFILTPTLSARIFSRGVMKSEGGDGTRGGLYAYVDRAYTWMLAGVMRHQIITASVAVCIIASSYFLFGVVKAGFLPQGVDQAEFRIDFEGPQGSTFAQMNDLMESVEADLQKNPHITSTYVEAGGGWLGGVNNGNASVTIPPHEVRYPSFGRFFKSLIHGEPMATFRGNYTQTDVMNEVRASLKKYQTAGYQVRVRDYGGFNIGGGNFDIDFAIAGPDLQQLAKYADELSDRAEKIGGILNLDTTLELKSPELRVSIDRERASDLGISPTEIGTAVRLLVGGDEEITRYRDPQTNENYDVRLRLRPEDRKSETQVSNLLLADRGGRPVELRSLATLVNANAASRIDRLDRSRTARLRGSIAPGAALQERTDALLAEWGKMNPAPAYTVSVRGAGREFEKTYREFLYAFALSIVFMYMILASQYENLIHPVVILLSLPLAVPFALLSLYLAGQQLNLYSALGILVLFGVVKKNSILQIDHINHLRGEGLNRLDAIMQGNRDRLRPILMTTLALVAGMLPLALGTGPGAEERRAVAVVVIGGQSLSLLLTLLVTPVAYSLFDDAAARVKAWRTRPRAEVAPNLALARDPQEPA